MTKISPIFFLASVHNTQTLLSFLTQTFSTFFLFTFHIHRLRKYNETKKIKKFTIEQLTKQFDTKFTKNAIQLSGKMASDDLRILYMKILVCFTSFSSIGIRALPLGISHLTSVEENIQRFVINVNNVNSWTFIIF